MKWFYSAASLAPASIIAYLFLVQLNNETITCEPSPGRIELLLLACVTT
jgi:hypothetical protein